MNASSGYVTTVKDIPTVPHYAIIQTRNVHIPGDERSRTNPGHGYPAHDEPTISYNWYLDQKEWEARIGQLVQNGDKFAPITAKVCSVETKLHISVNV